MREENEGRPAKGNTVLLTIIAVATLLVAVIGATFAYFSVTITGNDTATSVIVKTATLGISYESGNVILAENIIPGTVIPTKTFTVTNSGEVAMTYKISWVDVTNTFQDGSGDPTELKYSIAGSVTTGTGTTSSLAITQAPLANGDITGMTSITVDPGATHTFVLTMSFPETGADQNHNQGKSFMGKIQVTADNVTNP